MYKINVSYWKTGEKITMMFFIHVENCLTKLFLAEDILILGFKIWRKFCLYVQCTNMEVIEYK
jgi:hypothetical protein